MLSYVCQSHIMDRIAELLVLIMVRCQLRQPSKSMTNETDMQWVSMTHRLVFLAFHLVVGKREPELPHPRLEIKAHKFSKCTQTPC
jgi:hypothetical protein